MYHCVPRIISGLSQISGLSLNMTINDTATGNRYIRRKCREELRDRLDDIGDLRSGADPYADWHPNHAGDRDQHHNAGQGRKSKQQSGGDVGSVTSSMTKRPTCQTATAPSAVTIMAHWNVIQPCCCCGSRTTGVARLGPACEKDPPPHGRERPGEAIDEARAAEHCQHPRVRRQHARLLLEAEAVCPSYQRPKQHLIVDQDHDEHRDDRIADGRRDPDVRWQARCRSRRPAA